MKKDIIFAGVGGQGVVSAAAMFVSEAARLGFVCKQNEVHGMAQRGGAVVCFVRVSDKAIYSDIVPKGACDIILATEPMEALRYTDYLSKDGVIITSNKPVVNIAYPEIEEVLAAVAKYKNHVIVDCEMLSQELKSEKVMNVAMVGALSKVLAIDGLREGILKGIEKKFAEKGKEVVDLNFKAFEFGESAASLR
jgi:indolepyruvate ferredoxin oxidoreductase beta subunit